MQNAKYPPQKLTVFPQLGMPVPGLSGKNLQNGSKCLILCLGLSLKRDHPSGGFTIAYHVRQNYPFSGRGRKQESYLAQEGI